MHFRALKTFQSRYGLIRTGTIFQPAPNYAKALLKNKLIEPVPPPGPGETREDKSIPSAPLRKQPGKGEPGKAPQPGSTTAPTPDAGAAPSQSASDQDPASPGTTLTTSGAGGRRAVTTPKRKRAKQSARTDE